MNRMRPSIALCVLLLGCGMAQQGVAQSTILQGGPFADGHVPMYAIAGSDQAVLLDSGPAGGGTSGVGLSELLLTYRAAGTGPGGTNLCDYDAPTDTVSGYHYLCFGATPAGGLLSYGAEGGAASLPLTISIDGQPSLVIGPGGVIGTVPVPTPTSLGGAFSSTAPANQFGTGLNTSGQLTYAQPSFTNLSGTAASAQVSGAYPGITGVGTLASGTWNGSMISPTFGGTGVNNGAKTLTLGGNLATAGAFNSTITMTGPTAVTMPTSGTLATLANNLGQFSTTTSAQLAGVISDETGTGSLVFGTSPAIAAPALSGTSTGTYTLGGTPTLAGGTITGNTTLPGGGQISSAGLLGIGMTPANAIDATSTQNSASRLSIINASTGTAATAAVRANNGTNSLTATLFGTGFTASGLNRADGALVSSNASSGGLTLATGAAQPVYVGVNNTQVAEFATTGDLLVNTTTDDGVNKLQVNGGIKGTGINFGGTTLGTYVEGTWTPTLTFGGGSTGITYGTQTGRYVQIGKQVTAQFAVTLTSKGSSTGTATISGLPIANNSSVNAGAIIGSAINVTLTGSPDGSVVPGATVITLQQWGTGGTAPLADTNLSNTTAMTGTVSYITN